MAFQQYPGGCVEVGRIPADRPREAWNEGSIHYSPVDIDPYGCPSGWIYQDLSSAAPGGAALAVESPVPLAPETSTNLSIYLALLVVLIIGALLLRQRRR